jgi:hypothetical protein
LSEYFYFLSEYFYFLSEYFYKVIHINIFEQ